MINSVWKDKVRVYDLPFQRHRLQRRRLRSVVSFLQKHQLLRVELTLNCLHDGKI